MKCIAICGDSGSGKSTMAAALLSRLPRAMILECDRYHKWERHDNRWKEFTHLNVDANDISLMNKDVDALKSGNRIFRRDYDHATGTFTRDVEIKPAENIIVCGLHSFFTDYDVGIFMDTDVVLKTQWKIARDIDKRGYSLRQVKEQIKRREKDYERFIRPMIDHADIIVNFHNENDLYVDSIKGIGRFLRLFVKSKYIIGPALQHLDDIGVKYNLLLTPAFFQIDIEGCSYEHILPFVTCILILN